jgi:hypothetical protein
MLIKYIQEAFFDNQTCKLDKLCLDKSHNVYNNGYKNGYKNE